MSDKATAVLGAAARHDRPPSPPAGDQPLFFGLVLIVAVGGLKILLRKRLSSRHMVSLDLVMVSVGFILLLMLRLPLGGHSGWMGVLLFFALVGLYRLLGYFEE